MSVIIGKKLGMSRIFDEHGRNIPVTVIEAGPCYVTQIKTIKNDGYEAVQLGFHSKREKVTIKPLLGHFKKAGISPVRVIKEFKNYNLGDAIKLGYEVKVDMFSEGDVISVTGTSKGKGFAGTVKRHGFSGGPKTHGQSDRLRAPGSLGQSSYPSRVFKGVRMSGRMGGDRKTLKSVQIVKVDTEKNLLIVKGAVPGANQGILFIRKK